MNETIRMQLSAFVDGELPEGESELFVRRLSQDAELRAEIAEHIEIGRALRGESSIAGIHELRARVASAIDSDVEETAVREFEKPRRRVLKPLGSIAVAASVALVAIIGLQQRAGEPLLPGDAAVATTAEEYVVPPEDPELQRYLQMHGETSAAAGANGMNFRIVSLPTGAEPVEGDTAEPEGGEDDIDDVLDN